MSSFGGIYILDDSVSSQFLLKCQFSKWFEAVPSHSFGNLQELLKGIDAQSNKLLFVIDYHLNNQTADQLISQLLESKPEYKAATFMLISAHFTKQIDELKKQFDDQIDVVFLDKPLKKEVVFSALNLTV